MALTSFLSRALVLYCALVSGYDNVHLRSCLPRAEEALKYGQSGGDRIWTCFAGVHTIQIKLYICEHRTSDADVGSE